ncbi:MAG: M48 family metallopeptidase [Bacteroidetes bacterium]|nr:M48 family metallopeptidase [Bacteroidota bacterium]
MNTLFIIIVAIIIIDFAFGKILDFLNLKNLSPDIPKEAEGIYDPDKYKKSQEYYKVNHNFSMLTSSVTLVAMLLMLFLNGFSFVDSFVRTYTQNPILMALLFFGILGFASDILGMPFSLYQTFVIEEKFGFNKTSVTTFILDKLKGYLLAAIVGGGLFALIIWIYQSTGSYFWLFAWSVISFFTIFITMFYTTFLVPIFNKLTPLPEGELRTAIEAYCKKVGFKLNNLFVIDGSKRSAKANAYFSGLGSKKTIVLYDTLIEKHSTEELVAVLAHEVGHYKKKHTLTGTIQGVIQTGVMLFIMSLFLGNPELSKALSTSASSFHLDILVFGLLYSPLSEILSIISNIISRKHEFEADAYAKETYSGTALQTALKKLSVDNLSNLKPHPAYVFVHYSHPPVLERLRALSHKA